MHNSSQNQNLLKSKAANYIQESEYIMDENEFYNPNKQNYLYYFNKSNQSYQLSKSNNSYVSMAKERSGMVASKSQSIILAQSKVNNMMAPVQQNFLKSKLTNKSMLKSYQNGPLLKVLTQSDLTQYEDQQDHIFSDSQYQTYYHKPNTSTRSKNIQVNPSSIRKDQHLNGHKQNRNTNSRKSPQKTQQHQSMCIQAPQFSFIPGQKLQIRHFSSNQSNLISLTSLISLIPHKLSILKSIKKLSIKNSFLSSLEGIEQFQLLQEVNLRQNQLREVEQLYRIKDKHKISSINIIGNDIEHYHLGRYKALSQVFPNLIELNDKNYAMLKRKQQGDMRRVLKKSAKLEYELRKTLKKQTRNTDRALIRLNPSNIQDQEQTQRTHRSQRYYQQMSDNKATQKDEYSYENEGGYSNRHYNSSISRRSTSQVRSPTHPENCSATSFNKKKQIDQENEVYQIQHSNLNPNSYSLGESRTQKQYSRHCNKGFQLRQVSLGNLQNVPITKSVKYSQKSPAKYNKRHQENKQNINMNEIPLQTVPIGRNLLEIRTQGLQNQSQLGGQMHQPTATFAMQKQRQQQCSLQNRQFMFKNKKPNNQNNKTKTKRQLKDQQQIFEQFENDDEDNELSLSRISRISQIPTKRLSNNRKSMTSNFRYQQKSRYQNNQNPSEQSFMTGNQLYPNPQNNSYMAFSQISQWRPNSSMDEDCLLKDNKNGIQQEKLAIATAIYMQNLIKKSMLALFLQSTKRKNLPKKKSCF